ncbi:MAG: DUF1015 domain-containing protein [Desulfobacterales bacterium]|nr:DUF1015 domain-containing protein [Desulfobacterales bacterium]
MAKIIPFQGVLYNKDKISDLSQVVTPPYDVISPEEQDNFYKKSEYSIVRLILNKKTEQDDTKNNPHIRASEFFKSWMTKKILINDVSPSFYLTTVEFSVDNQKYIRHGLIGLVELEPFEKGIILPHEKTFSKIKSERLGLMKACKANFSPIFSIYPDEDNAILKILKDECAKKQPDMDFSDDKGYQHKLWRITDTSIQNQISLKMQEKTIFIADGHHRYETALNYRDLIAKEDPSYNSAHKSNYIMMYLCSMNDEGMKILPAHRIIKKVASNIMDSFIEKSKKYFDIKEIKIDEITSKMKTNESETIIGVLIKNSPSAYIFKLKQKAMDQFTDEMPASLRLLDVTVLTRLLLTELLSFDQAKLDDAALIEYSSLESKTIQYITSGNADIAFMLNPTKIEQVRSVALEQLTMPRKSTYFYPKVITGQVINSLEGTI